MREWVVPLPFTVPFLGLNQTLHKAVKSQRIKAIRTAAEEGAVAVGVPHLDRFTVELHYVPKTRQRRDPENWVPTSKAVTDGFVLAGVADDDSPEYFTPSLPVMDEPDRDCELRFYAIIRDLSQPEHTCPVPGCGHASEEKP